LLAERKIAERGDEILRFVCSGGVFTAGPSVRSGRWQPAVGSLRSPGVV
jgi:hypothetical protein